MTVAPPMDSMGQLYGLYMMNIVVLPLCLPNDVTNVLLPRPDESCPLLIMAEVSLFKDIIVVLFSL